MFCYAEAFASCSALCNTSNVIDEAPTFKHAESLNSGVTVMPAVFNHGGDTSRPINFRGTSSFTDWALVVVYDAMLNQPIGDRDISSFSIIALMFNYAVTWIQPTVPASVDGRAQCWWSCATRFGPFPGVAYYVPPLGISALPLLVRET